MPDINHWWSDDIQQSASGDFLLTTGLDRSRQRILRRLLTNPGEYVWHPDFGGGIPQYIGATLDLPVISSRILNQVMEEESVARDPAPEITLTPHVDGLMCHIKYIEEPGRLPQTIEFNIGE